MAEAIAGDVIVSHFGNELRLQRLPFLGAFGGPAARAARRISGEPGPTAQGFELLGERGANVVGDAGRESDMMENTIVIVETEKQRADERAVGRIAKSADDTVGGAQALDLEPAALAHQVRLIETLGDDAVERAGGASKPCFGRGSLARIRRKAQRRRRLERGEERLERDAALRERPIDQGLAAGSNQEIERR